jgi:dihydrolipoamide dehydrogenase
MAENFDFDLIIIGSGPGGYVAGIRAGQLGLKTAVIEKGKPGGVCLNIGCIPTKSLVHSAKVHRNIKELESMGVKCDTGGFDYSKVFKKSRKAADMLSKGVSFLLKKNNVEFIEGTGKVTGEHEVTIDNEKKLTAKNIIIATGARPKELKPFPVDHEKIITSDDALMLEKLPKKMIILGAGFIGIEISYIMNSFGVNIEVVEMLDQILPIEDEETVEVYQKLARRNKVKFHTSTSAQSVEKTDTGINLLIKDPEGNEKKLEADMLLVAIGRVPNTEDIGLENVGIETEGGYIPVGDYYQTKVPSIYAIGDVTATPQLAHVAFKEAEIAVEHIAGLNPHEKKVDVLAIPSAIYSEPQIGSFGYSEKKLKEMNKPYHKAVFPYRGAGKSVVEEQSEGLVKVLTDPETKEILGTHIVGLDASEIIHEVLLAKTAELLPEDIARMMHAHPTISEVIKGGMEASEGWAIHV